MTRNIILLFYLLLAGCDLLDEDPPKIPTNIRGYFTVTPTTSDTTINGTDTTITKYNPRIHISWEESSLIIMASTIVILVILDRMN